MSVHILSSLKVKISSIQELIAKESKSKVPNGDKLKKLKKHRLFLKDKFSYFSRLRNHIQSKARKQAMGIKSKRVAS